MASANYFALFLLFIGRCVFLSPGNCFHFHFNEVVITASHLIIDTNNGSAHG